MKRTDELEKALQSRHEAGAAAEEKAGRYRQALETIVSTKHGNLRKIAQDVLDGTG